MLLFIKKIYLFIGASCLLAFLSLSGCATLAQPSVHQTECATSRILITDLTQPVAHRKALLPSGELCAGEDL